MKDEEIQMQRILTPAELRHYRLNNRGMHSLGVQESKRILEQVAARGF